MFHVVDSLMESGFLHINVPLVKGKQKPNILTLECVKCRPSTSKSHNCILVKATNIAKYKRILEHRMRSNRTSVYHVVQLHKRNRRGAGVGWGWVVTILNVKTQQY